MPGLLQHVHFVFVWELSLIRGQLAWKRAPTSRTAWTLLSWLFPAPLYYHCSTTVFSHSQTVVVCTNCNTVLCVPTGGKARLTEGCSFRKKAEH